jgi:hypothetical protein
VKPHSASLDRITRRRNVTFDTSLSTVEHVHDKSALRDRRQAVGANLSHLLTSEEWMNKKEIESPKLTGNFLVWIGLFLLLIVALAKFALKLF